MKRRFAPDVPLDDYRFPPEEWALTERYFDPTDMGKTETLFAVANGYLGMRGVTTEGQDAYYHGTFVNGFHETWPIRHAEDAYGFATTGQTLINVPSCDTIKLYVDDEPLVISVADIQEYSRRLDFRDGVLTRELIWRTPAGKRVKVKSTRMVSFTARHLALMTYEVTMLDGNAPITISSHIANKLDYDDERQVPTETGAINDPRRNRTFDHRVLIPRMDWYSQRRMIMGYQAANSGMTIAIGADHEIFTSNQWEQIDATTPDLGRKVYRIAAQEGEPIVIHKAAAYHTSRGALVRELSDRVRRTLDRVRDVGFEHYYERQKDWLDEFWRRSDVRVGTDTRVQQSIRWCIFQLAQASARTDGQGVPAKGLTGDGYEGHFFWDAEVYLVPFLTLTQPHAARNVLRFRATHLDQARERARVLAVSGALFPWRTINGEEASAYYAAGTAQYHIDADIAYAIGHYGSMSGDTEFLYGEGAAILVETARMWADLGFWRFNSEESFEIHGVTGPDEYTTVVNNNTYTNVMARWNLRLAVDVVSRMKREAPLAYGRLVHALGLRDEELESWRRCADGMKIPFDSALGIHPQDDDFINKELWDLENTDPENYPLLLHFHPLVIYRFQVLKQADVVLALYLRSSEFSLEQKRADFEYYDPITTGDSSLSAVTQCIIAAEVGHQDMALDYFYQGLYVDLADTHGNTADGVHIASTAGTWRALVSGFGGLRDDTETPRFDPRLPKGWEYFEFSITVRGAQLDVRLERDSITLSNDSGDPVTVNVRGVDYAVGTEPVCVPLGHQGIELPALASVHPVIGGRRADGTLIMANVPRSDGSGYTESFPAID